MSRLQAPQVLLLTLVHPDFLPPVYAIAQVLRDEGYSVHILTFDAPNDAGTGIEGVTIESVGKHAGLGLLQRIAVRRRYTGRLQQLVANAPAAIITFCAFTLLSGLSVRKDVPLAYHSLELADFQLSSLMRSPLSQFNNLLAIKRIHKAGFVSAASVQRSAWQAGRSRLSFMPHTIMNTVYMHEGLQQQQHSLFASMIPQEHHGKKMILYMGAVNQQNCVKELVAAFAQVYDAGSVMLVAGMKENEYCEELRQMAETLPGSKGRVVFFPFLKGQEKDALQSNADIGVCLSYESRDNIESMMTAPNKVGEYLAKGLYLLSSDTEYMRPFGMRGIASLAVSSGIDDIASAMKVALQAVNDKSYKSTINNFVRDFYCMQVQAAPLVSFIKGNSRS